LERERQVAGSPSGLPGRFKRQRPGLARCFGGLGPKVPKLITRQGKEGVVMISDVQYEQLVGRSHQPKSIVQFFRESPLVGVDLNLEREKDEGREIEL